MIPTFNRDQFSETDLHVHVAEASDLGIKPGQVHQQFHTNLGNSQDMVLEGVDQYGALRYRQMMGCITVKVFND